MTAQNKDNFTCTVVYILGFSRARNRTDTVFSVLEKIKDDSCPLSKFRLFLPAYRLVTEYSCDCGGGT